MAQRRPDLRVAYETSMRVTHLEFVRGMQRAKRLSLYTQTNSKIDTFHELGFWRRVGVLGRMLRPRRSVASAPAKV